MSKVKKKTEKKVVGNVEQIKEEVNEVFLFDLSSLTRISQHPIGTMMVLKNKEDEISVTYKDNGVIQFTHYKEGKDTTVNLTFNALNQLIHKIYKN